MLLYVALIAWFGGTGAEAMQAAREPMRVDGSCKSGCAWSFLTNPQACFTRRAEFYFHSFADPSGLKTEDTKRIAEVATSVWLDRIPVKLRPLAERDWTGTALKLVTSRQMSKLLPERICK